jgi:hypothetical protein
MGVQTKQSASRFDDFLEHAVVRPIASPHVMGLQVGDAF